MSVFEIRYERSVNMCCDARFADIYNRIEVLEKIAGVRASHKNTPTCSKCGSNIASGDAYGFDFDGRLFCLQCQNPRSRGGIKTAAITI